MSLPILQSADVNLTAVQTRWAAQLNPLLSQPLSQALLLSDLTVVSGANVINHKLGRKLQGYIVVGCNAAVTFHDSQASNSMPQLTLNLVASGAATINLLVF
jgi:hypothetical protein